MHAKRVIIIGGGAAGFFGAITCAEHAPAGTEIQLLEKGPQFLAKVRISGGGRCNVTHACFDGREFTNRYPRGRQALIGPFARFQAHDTVEWFAARGVPLKTEEDGRMFPITDTSQTVIDCLMREAANAGVQLFPNRGVEKIEREPEKGFKLTRSNGQSVSCDLVLLATGGCRTPALAQLAVSLGHTIETPVPSLFTFHIESNWLRTLAGVSVPDAEASVPGTDLREQGPLLITHWGLSGPAVLRLSAWGARELHQRDYRFLLHINWLPKHSADSLLTEFQGKRDRDGAKLVLNAPIQPLPGRLWEQLVAAAGIGRDVRWSTLSRTAQQSLLQQLLRSEFQVTGKSLNKDEFVTCGGVKLNEVNFKTMESRRCPGLYFAGELLDIDGITGGFNFQAAWTTGWIAGNAMAEAAAGS